MFVCRCIGMWIFVGIKLKDLINFVLLVNYFNLFHRQEEVGKYY